MGQCDKNTRQMPVAYESSAGTYFLFHYVIPADGPIRGIVAIATGTGGVKGYVGTPMLGDMVSLPDAIGRGAVQIVKNHPDWPRPYNGITEIRHGDIDRDIGECAVRSVVHRHLEFFLSLSITFRFLLRVCTQCL